nr:SAVED domain-containing protein [Morganella morganii]
MIDLDYRSRQAREDDPAYWKELARQMQDDFDSQMHRVGVNDTHLSIFGFAPMPLLMQLGALIGNKTEVSTMQWNRVAESWSFPKERTLEPQSILFDDVFTSKNETLAVRICLSGEVAITDIQSVVPRVPIVRFGVPAPTPLLVESQEDVRHFRSQFTAFMALVRNHGYKRLHIFPAMPLSLAVELGRQLLPKVDPAIEVWDYQDGMFKTTLTLTTAPSS